MMFPPCEKRAIVRTMPQDKGAEDPRRSHGAAQSECRTRSAGKWVVAAAGEESGRAERECEDAQFGEIQSQGEVSQATGWRRQLSAHRSILGRHTWDSPERGYPRDAAAAVGRASSDGEAAGERSAGMRSAMTSQPV